MLRLGGVVPPSPLGSAAPSLALGSVVPPPLINCSAKLLGKVIDAPPIRASLRVMEHVASLAAGRSFVEIGSRHGDLIDCVSHLTSSAVSIEGDHHYCKTLKRRADASGGRWSTVCTMFTSETNPMPRGSLYFTWVPHYLDVPFLFAFAAQQARGGIPNSSRIAVGFDMHHPPEVRCWRAIRRFSESHTRVAFDERIKGLRGNQHRRHGNTTIAVFAPANISMAEVQRATNNICHKGDPSRATRTIALGS